MLTYEELITFDTFEERFEYLRLDGKVCDETFGHDRYLNQALYHSPEWRRFKRGIIIRDQSCDLGVEGYEIHTRPLIHHLNPVTMDMILERDPLIFDPNNVITTCLRTHNAIHYSDIKASSLSKPVERFPNDTCPWKR